MNGLIAPVMIRIPIPPMSRPAPIMSRPAPRASAAGAAARPATANAIKATVILPIDDQATAPAEIRAATSIPIPTPSAKTPTPARRHAKPIAAMTATRIRRPNAAPSAAYPAMMSTARAAAIAIIPIARASGPIATSICRPNARAITAIESRRIAPAPASEPSASVAIRAM